VDGPDSAPRRCRTGSQDTAATARVRKSLEPTIRSLTDTLIDEILAGAADSFELMSQLAFRVPNLVICHLSWAWGPTWLVVRSVPRHGRGRYSGGHGDPRFQVQGSGAWERYLTM